MIKCTLPKRGTDAWGSGDFGASRGNRVHKGIDYACYPKTVIDSPISGEVTKLGYPYADDLSYRYVEISDVVGNKHRLFYVQPLVQLKEFVAMGDPVGVAQNIAGRYSTPEKYMKNHIHYEILDLDGQPINPEEF